MDFPFDSELVEHFVCAEDVSWRFVLRTRTTLNRQLLIRASTARYARASEQRQDRTSTVCPIRAHRQSIRTDFNGLLAMQFMMPPPQTAPRNGDTGSAFVEFTVRRRRSLAP